MELVKLTHDNIDQEHICCAISSNKDVQVMSKKAWLKERLDEGLVFLKGNVRGKCFIEYIPAEYAWMPIEAEGYMVIDCLWVSGQFKGHGYSNLLLDACIEDSKEKGKKGLVILSSKKKLGFLSDPGYMRHKGFVTADTAEPYFELLYLPLEEGAERPRFRDTVREHGDMPRGFVLYYTNQWAENFAACLLFCCPCDRLQIDDDKTNSGGCTYGHPHHPPAAQNPYHLRPAPPRDLLRPGLQRE